MTFSWVVGAFAALLVVSALLAWLGRRAFRRWRLRAVEARRSGFLDGMECAARLSLTADLGATRFETASMIRHRRASLVGKEFDVATALREAEEADRG